MNCKHKWKDVKDGTRDKICLKCGKKAMQGAMTMSAKVDASAPILEPMAKKEIIIPLYTGDNIVNIKAYEDEVRKSIMKAIGLPGINMRVGE